MQRNVAIAAAASIVLLIIIVSAFGMRDRRELEAARRASESTLSRRAEARRGDSLDDAGGSVRPASSDRRSDRGFERPAAANGRTGDELASRSNSKGLPSAGSVDSTARRDSSTSGRAVTSGSRSEVVLGALQDAGKRGPRGGARGSEGGDGDDAEAADFGSGEAPTFESPKDHSYPTNGFTQLANVGNVNAEAGSIAFKLKTDWPRGSQDDADMITVADGLFKIRKNVNFMRFEFTDDDGIEGGIGAPINEWDAGQEHDVVATWSGNTAWLYYDGKLVSRGDRKGTFTVPDEPTLGIGTADANERRTAGGSVAGVQILDRPYTAGEIADRMKPKPPAK